ncbi:N-acetylmuramoyl-L-alanine amidase [Segniliparus rugosus]|uniref:MurNAc-LAA domain-containing protein n=1 Tax=Segniliparus rugosus (strain ATCC BAA-974 / DSM 45345 / CCUG 50838 / CIP 108380 / JCM 13579 / CDC 945) TaxID=679197 RepID=E5XVA9_SEGRC|nr:N-acetylmuramoyl-L-alanine amidase [Segniliparus rugosus]EFV11722.1 hypothetical protein HMPREF9336_03431 [Segniliparus rugosus ATCC BAA-974]
MVFLRRGDIGPEVIAVRAVLEELGFLHSRNGSANPNLASATAARTEFGSVASANGSETKVEALFDAELDLAVRAFQQHRGMLVDGIVGPATSQCLREASFRLGARVTSYQPSAPMVGDDVADLQARLHDLGFYMGLVDGYFGPKTHNGLVSYQREFGLTPDGICGPATLRSLNFLGSRVTGGSAHELHEREVMRMSGPRLEGKRIVIDPGCGAEAPGLVVMGSHGPTSEADVLWDLATRLEGRMVATGMEAGFSRSHANSPTDEERAQTANAYAADIVLALRCATQESPLANGVACFHFGNALGYTSAVGRQLAELIQRELVARTPLRDCRTHGRTWPILRATKMPCVQVNIGYLSNPADRAFLSEPSGRDIIAEGILVAVKRLYLLGRGDSPTGSLTFEDLLLHEQRA